MQKGRGASDSEGHWARFKIRPLAGIHFTCYISQIFLLYRCTFIHCTQHTAHCKWAQWVSKGLIDKVPGCTFERGSFNESWNLSFHRMCVFCILYFVFCTLHCIYTFTSTFAGNCLSISLFACKSDSLVSKWERKEGTERKPNHQLTDEMTGVEFPRHTQISQVYTTLLLHPSKWEEEEKHARSDVKWVTVSMSKTSTGREWERE